MFRAKPPVSDPKIRDDFLAAIVEIIDSHSRNVVGDETKSAKAGGFSTIGPVKEDLHDGLLALSERLDPGDQDIIDTLVYDRILTAFFHLANYIDGTADFTDQNGIPSLTYEVFKPKRIVYLADPSAAMLHDDLVDRAFRAYEARSGKPSP